MDKENVIYIKKNEIMSLAGKWTKLEVKKDSERQISHVLSLHRI
jgi:hypothetical protein